MSFAGKVADHIGVDRNRVANGGNSVRIRQIEAKINTKIADIIRELESFTFMVKFKIVRAGFSEVDKGTFGGVKFNIEGTSAGKNDFNHLREAKTSGGKEEHDRQHR